MRKGKASLRDGLAAWVGKVARRTLLLIMALLLLAMSQATGVSPADIGARSGFCTYYLPAGQFAQVAGRPIH